MKFAICILVHHKDWLIHSSLISLLLQKTNLKYDLHFIIIKGDGKKVNKSSYKIYNHLSKLLNQKNEQLSDYDSKTVKLIKKINKKYKFHFVDNDQGLDSSAWIKFIKKKIYLKYDYSLFLMEGFLFTSENVLEGIKNFVKNKKPNFMTSGHEKRIILKKYFSKNFLTNRKEIKSMSDLESKFARDIFLQFSKDKKFKNLISKWPSYINNNRNRNIIGRTENHSTKYKLSFYKKIKLFLKSLVFRGNLVNIKNYKFIVTEERSFFQNFKISLKNIYKFKDIVFHHEKSPYFYGCSCQHLMSKSYIKQLEIYLTKNKINELLKLPFFATPFEILWAIFPSIFGYKKWFFNGIHRPRKHFLDLNRDDDIQGVTSYLNLYFSENAKFEIKNKKIFVNLKNKNNSKLNKALIKLQS